MAPTDTFLLTAKPPYAVIAWVDDAHVFIELPSKGTDAPYIMRFDLCDAGLGKALKLMRQGYLDARKPTPTFRKTRGPSRPASPFSQAQRDAALLALKKVGFI